MAESIKDKVAIIGMGCTQFGELWDKDADDLIVDAVYAACADAGIELKDIEAAWVGTIADQTGASAGCPLQLQYIPVTRVENACATGAESIRGPLFALAAKAYDLVLAVGYEKMKDEGYGGLHPLRHRSEKWHPVFMAAGSAPGRYALSATRYFQQYGLTPDEGKRTIGKISVKSHYNGARNPRAMLRREVSLEDVLNAPMIAWPLGLYDCCGVTDGGAAAIMCRTEDVKKYKPGGFYVTIKGSGISIGPGWGKTKEDYDYTHWPETEHAAKYAYEMAGIKDPRKELDMVELHDCFSIAELIAMESLGLCQKGHAKDDIDIGTFTSPQFREPILELCGATQEELAVVPERFLPVNLSGGLKSFGHPIGASGAREVYEIYKEIEGKAEYPSRQLSNARLGLAHNQGGHPGRFQCGITIIGAP
jgi:acetyl-CoA C-acetyltransferase